MNYRKVAMTVTGPVGTAFDRALRVVHDLIDTSEANYVGACGTQINGFASRRLMVEVKSGGYQKFLLVAAEALRVPGITIGAIPA